MLATIIIAMVLHAVGVSLIVAEQTIVDTVWVRNVLETFGRPGYFNGLAIGNNSQVMLAAYGRVGGTHSVFQIDMATGIAIDSMPTPFNEVKDFVMASKAGVFAIGGVGNVIHIYRWPEKTLIREIRDTAATVLPWQYPFLAITSDGRKLYNGTSNKLFDVETGDVLWVLPQRGGTDATPVITPDDQYLLTLAHNLGGNAALLMEVATGRWMATFPGGSGGSIQAVGISDDARYTAVYRPEFGSEKQSLVVYDRGTQTIVMDTIMDGANGFSKVYGIHFTHESTGMFVCASLVRGYGNVHDLVHYRFGSWQPDLVVKYGGQKRTADWKYFYGMAGGQLWLSRANLDPVGVQEQSPGAVEVFPQPSSGSLELRNVPASDGSAVVRMMAMEGRLAFEQEVFLMNGRCLIVTEGLSSGVYVLRLSRQGQVLCSTSVVIR
jgi:hypothetical protein